MSAMRNSPPEEGRRFQNLYWVIRLTGVLEHILLKQTAKEMREAARDGLAEIADPETGIKDLPDDVALGWRVAILRSEKKEKANE